MNNDIAIIAAKSDDVFESIEEAYNKDGANKFNDDKLRRAVLDGNVPTAIADAGASTSCGKPSVSDCGRYILDSDPFVATG